MTVFTESMEVRAYHTDQPYVWIKEALIVFRF
jgi:hypothetical protein